MDETETVKGEKRSLGPVPAAAIAIGGGILAFIIISIIGLVLRIIMGLVLVGLISPFYEEPLKVIGLILVALFFAGTYKSRKEGAILGIIAGLTFGVLEILDYWVLYHSLISIGALTSGVANTLLVIRFFTSLPMQAISSLIVGLGIAYAAMSSPKPGLRNIFSGNSLAFLAVAIGFHLVYNIFNLVPMILLNSSVIGALVGFVAMLGGLYLAYRIYKWVPERLDQMSPTGAKELVIRALGRRAGRGAAVPENKP